MGGERLACRTVPVAVVTDSTAGIPEALRVQWGIRVVQLQLRLDERVDDEDRFERDELFDALRAAKPVATAPPETGAFFWAYQDAVSSGADSIVSVHISGQLSATADAAREAAAQVNIPVHVLDSQTTGMSLGFAALSAARAAAAGAPARRVIDVTERRYQHSSEIIYVPTLEYLRRGGRIGAAAALLGNALSIKPLLTVADGSVAPLARVPGSKRALARLVDLAVARAGDGPVEVAISCTESGERESTVAEQLRARLNQLEDVLTVQASTVISAHVGPEALGITVCPAS